LSEDPEPSSEEDDRPSVVPFGFGRAES
jgi:hypothetical protein